MLLDVFPSRLAQRKRDVFDVVLGLGQRTLDVLVRSHLVKMDELDRVILSSTNPFGDDDGHPRVRICQHFELFPSPGACWLLGVHAYFTPIGNA